MHAAQTRPRRHDRTDEDDLFAVARGTERRPGSFHRSHHHSGRTNPYGNSSTPQRTYAEASHSRRTDDWRGADPTLSSVSRDGYRDDVALHSRRGEYYDRPEGWSSRHTQHSQFSSSRRGSTKRDNLRYSSTSYSGNRSWGRAGRYEGPARGNTGNDGWHHEGPRGEREGTKYHRGDGGGYSGREENLRPQDDVVVIEPSRGQGSPYRVENPNDQPQWQSEPGHYRERDVVHGPERTEYDTDRKWEPAPSWKSREQDDLTPARYERPEALPPFSRSGRKHGKNKKKVYQAPQKREARREDNMNNWQKREFIPAQSFKDETIPSSVKRRHDYTTESHPQSPAHSVHSYRSSNRSRSRSASPKRRKRANEPQDRIFSGFAAKKNNNHRGRSPPRSPSTAAKLRWAGENKDRTRRPSMSSRSSRSLSRSRSSSEAPEVKSKPKHRLPLATSIRDIEIQAKCLRLSSSTTVHQATAMQNAASAVLQDESEPELIITKLPKAYEAERSRNYRDEYETMPPPAAPASASLPASVNDLKSDAQPHNVDGTKAVRRNAGFKPIGTVQPSPAMKRFFPGEDEEPDSNNMQEDRQDKRGSESQSARPEDVDTRQRSGSTTPSSVRSDRELDAYTPRRQGQPRPSRKLESIDRYSTTHARRSEQSRARKPTSRQATSKADVQQASAPSTPRQSRRPSVNGEAYVNGRAAREISRPPSQPSEFPNRVEVASSPIDQQVEEPLGADEVQVPKDEIYAIVSQVGEGTFGKVYKARNNITGVHVALKRIRMETERDGFPVTAMREVKLLQSLRHVNIVQLMEMMVHRGSVYMIFEYMDHDLTGVLSQTQFAFTDAHLKSLCQQMLQGLSYLHRKGVIHRDIKGSNILINNRGELKLADFGLARFYQKRRRADYTNRVITLWYRPPELLLGTTVYGPEVDMWSAGCIMLELFCKKPVFQGNDEIHQLDVIYRILGTPTPKDWPSVTDMPWYELVKPRETLRNRFRELFKRWLSAAALDLAERLLSYDPEQRVTADQALEASYFMQEEPRPALPAGLSSLEGEWHEFESKRERARKRRKVESASAADSSGLPPQ